MSIYALELAQVQRTIRQTLVEKVLPGVESESARNELHAVIEMLDNLEARLGWDADVLSTVVSRSHALEAAVGGTPATDLSGVEALRASRRSIGDALKVAYTGGIDPAVVAAVTEFSTQDVLTEISTGLRGGLPE